MFGKKYKKIVEIPTGIVTRIKDTLEGRVEVSLEGINPHFDNPIHYVVTADVNTEEGVRRETLIIEATTEEDAMVKSYLEYSINNFINLKLLR